MKKIVVEFIGRLQDGGAETLVKDYALMLDKEKFDVVVLCEDYRDNSSIYKTLKQNNVRIVTMYEKSFFFNKVFARLFGKKYVASLFRKAINRIKPDIIHAHLELLEVLYHARDCLNDIDLFFTCHNPPKMLIGDERPAERDACRYLIDHNNLKIIALHDDMANEINKMFEIDNTSVIKNGIDINRFRNVNTSKIDKRKELGIPKDAYVIGQIGRFTYQKNPEFTIAVFNELLKKRNNSHLLLIGRGKEEDNLKKQVKQLQIENNVRILVSRDDIAELLKTMDVFIMPSRFEGFGIVLIEAQAAGLPCVVSDNVPNYAFQSKNITVLSLDDDKEKWADALLNPSGNISTWGNINDYDMHNEIKHLEELYLKEKC